METIRQISDRWAEAVENIIWTQHVAATLAEALMAVIVFAGVFSLAAIITYVVIRYEDK